MAKYRLELSQSELRKVRSQPIREMYRLEFSQSV